MYIQSTGCCGLKEITNLHDYDTPAEAMKAFCDKIWSFERYDYDGYGYTTVTNLKAKITGLVLFTAVVRHTNGTKVYPNPYYGPRFAHFIRKNKLGKIMGGPCGANRINHPTHVVRGWLWNPNPKTLKTWYNKYKKEAKKNGKAS